MRLYFLLKYLVYALNKCDKCLLGFGFLTLSGATHSERSLKLDRVHRPVSVYYIIASYKISTGCKALRPVPSLI